MAKFSVTIEATEVVRHFYYGIEAKTEEAAKEIAKSRYEENPESADSTEVQGISFDVTYVHKEPRR